MASPQSLPLRLMPGDDLRLALQAAVAARGWRAAFVLAGIGSLRPAVIRLAGAEALLQLDENLELLTLSGSVGADHTHLHLAVSGADGRVIGGHAGPGCMVRTTAEILMAPLPDWAFAREPDDSTGYDELVIRPLR